MFNNSSAEPNDIDFAPSAVQNLSDVLSTTPSHSELALEHNTSRLLSVWDVPHRLSIELHSVDGMIVE